MRPIYKLFLVKEGEIEYDKITVAKDVVAAVKPIFGHLDRECFAVLALGTKHRIIGANVVSIGSLEAAIVHPREVFKFAILANASVIIGVHNHPSGDCHPSDEDIKLTQKLVSSGDMLGIDMLDHIIIGDGGFISMKEEGYMNK